MESVSIGEKEEKLSVDGPEEVLLQKQMGIKEWAESLSFSQEKVSELASVADRLIDLLEADDEMLVQITKHWGRCVRYRFFKALKRYHLCDGPSLVAIDAANEVSMKASDMVRTASAENEDDVVAMKREEALGLYQMFTKMIQKKTEEKAEVRPEKAAVQQEEKNTFGLAAAKKEKKYQVGDEIEARFMSRTRYYPGVIAKILSDGTYCIHYDDGDKESRVEAKRIRVPRSKKKKKTMSLQSKTNHESTPGTDLSLPSLFLEGDIVERRFRNTGPYRPARIIRRRHDGTYDLQFENASKEFRVHSKSIALRFNSLSSCPDPTTFSESTPDPAKSRPLPSTKDLKSATDTPCAKKRKRNNFTVVPAKSEHIENDPLLPLLNTKRQAEKNFIDIEAAPPQTWIQCDMCEKWRQIDSNYQPPSTWTCAQHPDPDWSSCEIPMADCSEFIDVATCIKCEQSFGAFGDHNGLCPKCDTKPKKVKSIRRSTHKFSTRWLHHEVDPSTLVVFTHPTNPRQPISLHGLQAAHTYDTYSKFSTVQEILTVPGASPNFVYDLNRGWATLHDPITQELIEPQT